jgi:hypothetical protein
MSTTPVSPSAEPKSIGAAGRILGTIISPGETFADIARRPTWLVPLLLYIVVFCSITAVFGQRVGWERFIQQEIRRNPRQAEAVERMPAEQRQQMIRQQASLAPYFGYAMGTVGTLIGFFIISGVLLGAVNLLGGARLGYKTALGVTAHGFYVPWFLSGLMGLAFLLFDDPQRFDLRNPVPLNLGALWNEPAWLNSLGASLDVFSFWSLFLLAVGFRAAAPKKFTTGGAFVLVMVPWALYVLVKVGLSALFG